MVGGSLIPAINPYGHRNAYKAFMMYRYACDIDLYLKGTIKGLIEIFAMSDIRDTNEAETPKASATNSAGVGSTDASVNSASNLENSESETALDSGTAASAGGNSAEPVEHVAAEFTPGDESPGVLTRPVETPAIEPAVMLSAGIEPLDTQNEPILSPWIDPAGATTPDSMQWVPTDAAALSEPPSQPNVIEEASKSEQLKSLFSSSNIAMPEALSAAKPLAGSDIKTSAIQQSQKEKAKLDQPIDRVALVGQSIADIYQVMDILGDGELTTVYVAMDLTSDDLVAVKTPRHHEQQLRERFKAAIMQHGRLKHENIIKSLAYIETSGGQPFYVMEHIEGVCLEEILQSVGFIEEEETIASILLQISSALEHAHQVFVNHGRLTPKDIFLIDKDGAITVKVTDFGIADLNDLNLLLPATKAQAAFDTPYLSPERLGGQPASVLSDIYALGILTYRITTGRFPFHEAHGQPHGPEDSPDALSALRPDIKTVRLLDELLKEMLDLNPEWRMDSLSQFKEGVQGWINAARLSKSGVHPSLAADEGSIPPVTPSQSAEGSITDGGARTDTTSDVGAITRKLKRTGQNLSATINRISALKIPEDEQLTVSHEPEKPVKKKYKKPAGRRRNALKSTSAKLMSLRKHIFDEEQTLVVQFTAAAAGGRQRRSPVSTMARVVGAIIICGVLGIVSSTYIFSHYNELGEMWMSASRQLSMLLPRARRPGELTEEELERQRIAEGTRANKKTVKKQKNGAPAVAGAVAANPGSMAARFKQAPQYSPNESPSFGVTNNWRPLGGSRNPNSNKRRIEYREWKPR